MTATAMPTLTIWALKLASFTPFNLVFFLWFFLPEGMFCLSQAEVILSKSCCQLSPVLRKLWFHLFSTMEDKIFEVLKSYILLAFSIRWMNNLIETLVVKVLEMLACLQDKGAFGFHGHVMVSGTDNQM